MKFFESKALAKAGVVGKIPTALVKVGPVGKRVTVPEKARPTKNGTLASARAGAAAARS